MFFNLVLAISCSFHRLSELSLPDSSNLCLLAKAILTVALKLLSSSSMATQSYSASFLSSFWGRDIAVHLLVGLDKLVVGPIEADLEPLGLWSS